VLKDLCAFAMTSFPLRVRCPAPIRYLTPLTPLRSGKPK